MRCFVRGLPAIVLSSPAWAGNSGAGAPKWVRAIYDGENISRLSALTAVGVLVVGIIVILIFRGRK